MHLHHVPSLSYIQTPWGSQYDNPYFLLYITSTHDASTRPLHHTESLEAPKSSLICPSVPNCAQDRHENGCASDEAEMETCSQESHHSCFSAFKKGMLFFGCLSIYLSINLSIYLSIYVYIYIYIYLSIYKYIYIYIYMYIYIYILMRIGWQN